MELIAISNVETGFQVFLVVMGISALFISMIALAFFLADSSNLSGLVGVVGVLILVLTISLYSGTKNDTLYHYLIRDYDELELKLDNHDIYSYSDGIYKLKKK